MALLRRRRATSREFEARGNLIGRRFVRLPADRSRGQSASAQMFDLANSKTANTSQKSEAYHPAASAGERSALPPWRAKLPPKSGGLNSFDNDDHLSSTT